MDHFLWLENSLLPCPVVPFVCSDVPICLSRDFESFARWPAAQGWDLESSRDLAQLALRSQSWLYFGLLSITLGDKFGIENFTRTEVSGRSLLDSSQLPYLLRVSLKSKPFECTDDPPSRRPAANADAVELDDTNVHFAGHASYSGPAGSSSFAKQVYGCISHSVDKMKEIIIPSINEQARSLNGHRFSFDLWDSEAYAILFSLDVLLETVCDQMVEASPLMRGLGQLETKFAELTPGVANSIYRIGRCPCLPRRLELPSWRCLKLLSLPERDSAVSFDHSNCSYDQCSAFNVNPLSYESKHTSACQLCAWVEVSEETLVSIISRDGIPLVLCSEGHQGQLQLTLTEAQIGSEYTAISHVWAGGLGNFRSNSLPTCRIRSLLCDIAKLQIPPTSRYLGISHGAPVGKSVLFWLDTLCIPVKPEYADYRKTAIDSMARIYAGAESVLVLDPELESTKFERLKPYVDTQRFAISCSAWMARSWPLQEGALAVSLMVKFADCLINVNPQYEGEDKRSPHPTIVCFDMPFVRLQDLQTNHAARSLALDQRCMITWLRIDRNLVLDESDEDDPTWRFTWVWNSLRGRSTTQPEDVAAVLAALVDRSAGEIMNIPPHLRILALMKAQRILPLPIIYSSAAFDADASTSIEHWRPVLPGGSERVGPLSTVFGRIIISDQGAAIDFNGSQKTFCLTCPAQLPSSGSFRLLDERTNNSWLLTLGPTSFVNSDNIHKSRLFLLSEMECGEASTLYHGAQFIVEYEGDDRIQVNYGGQLKWASERLANTNDMPSIQTQVCRHDHSCPKEIIVGVDSASWPTLQWFRPDAFPFGQMGTEATVLTNWLPIPLLQGWIIYTAMQCIRLTVEWSLDPRSWLSVDNALFLSVSCIPIAVRIWLCHLESQIRTRIHRRVARQKWAASFWDSEASRRSLLQLNRGTSLGSWTFLACSLAASAASAGMLHKFREFVNSSPGWVVKAPLRDFAWSTTFYIVLELFIRLGTEFFISLRWHISVYPYHKQQRSLAVLLRNKRMSHLHRRLDVLTTLIPWLPFIATMAALIACSYYFTTAGGNRNLWGVFPLVVIGFLLAGTLLAFLILIRFVPHDRLQQMWRNRIYTGHEYSLE